MRRGVFKARHRALAGKRMMLGVLLALLLLAALAAAAPAAAAPKWGPPWSDVSAQTRQLYDVTNAQLATIDPGYSDRTWRPSETITRGWLALKAVPAFGIPLAYPDPPHFSDVPATDPLFPYVEGAFLAGFMNGYSASTWVPGDAISRVHTAVVIARWAARVKNYDLATLYSDQRIEQILGAYPDNAAISPVFRSTMAFAIQFGIIRADANGNLSPFATATRIESASMILHALKVPAPAWGPPWSDVSAQTRQLYDVTNAQLATIDPGYSDRTWRPSETITRGWLALKAVPAFGIPLAYPDPPTFLDVPATDPLFPYVEGAYAAGLMNGRTDDTWAPGVAVTRIQAAVTTARWAAGAKNYDLATLYTQQRIDELLARFPDTMGDPGGLVSAYGPVVAFAIDFGIIRADANGNLSPYNSATRIDTASMILHALKVPAPAWGPPWSDVSAQTRQLYDVTNAQLATIDPGYSDRTWRPSETITRGWLALKAVPAFGILLAYPDPPHFSDVPATDPLFPYVEGAYAAGLMNGRTDDTWAPGVAVTRIQAAVTTARWAAGAKNYDLATLYTQQRIDELLARFPDTMGDPGGLVSAYGPVVAFAIDFGIIRADANGNLSPYNSATRIDTASMILHALKVPAAV